VSRIRTTREDQEGEDQEEGLEVEVLDLRLRRQV
jgi:hypothetical protein